MTHQVTLKVIPESAPTSSGLFTVLDTATNGYDLVEMSYVTPTTDPVMGRVVESVVVRVTGTSLADMRTKIKNLFDVADMPRRWLVGADDRLVYLVIQPGDSGNVYQSRVHEMVVTLSNTLLQADWANWTTEVRLTYQRDGWWERTPVTPPLVTLTNPNGSATVLNVYNCNDGSGSAPTKRQNYVDIDTSDIPGDVPTPLYIEVHNNYNVAPGNETLYIGGVGRYSSTELPPLFLEAESGTGGTSTADATCSGGYKKTLTLTTAAETELLYWTVASGGYYAGLWYRILARFASTSSLGVVKFRWQIKSGSSIIWSGPQFLVGDAAEIIQEMGEVQLPTHAMWAGNFVLSLLGQRTTAVTETVYLDFIQLMASACSMKLVGLREHDYDYRVYAPDWRSLRSLRPARSYDVGYFYDWYTQWNDALYVNPGEYYRIHFLSNTDVPGTAEIARSFRVYVRCRPRYRAVGE